MCSKAHERSACQPPGGTGSRLIHQNFPSGQNWGLKIILSNIWHFQVWSFVYFSITLQ